MSFDILKLVPQQAGAVIGVPYEHLTNSLYAEILCYKLEQSDPNLLGFDTMHDRDEFMHACGRPIHRREFDAYKTILHFPDGYAAGINRGDGLCFIHAIATQWVLYWYSQDIDGHIVNERIVELRGIIAGLMPNGRLVLGLNDLEFVPIQGTVNEVLQTNAVLLHAIVCNALIAIIHSWQNFTFMAHVDVDTLEAFACDFRASFDITRNNNDMVTENSYVASIDNLARCHVLKLFGVGKLLVLQFAGIVRSNGAETDMKRKTNPLYLLKSFHLTGRKYAGFTMDIPSNQCMFPHHVSMMIHTFDTSHYDTLVAHQKGIPSVPCCACGSEEILPEQTTYSGKMVVMGANDVPMHFIP